MFSINLPVGIADATYNQLKAYCEHFNCILKPAKKNQIYYECETEDPVNFFWLGANMFLRTDNPLSKMPADIYLS